MPKSSPNTLSYCHQTALPLPSSTTAPSKPPPTLLSTPLWLDLTGSHAHLEISWPGQQPLAKSSPILQEAHHLSQAISIFGVTFGAHQYAEHRPLASKNMPKSTQHHWLSERINSPEGKAHIVYNKSHSEKLNMYPKKKQKKQASLAKINLNCFKCSLLSAATCWEMIARRESLFFVLIERWHFWKHPALCTETYTHLHE